MRLLKTVRWSSISGVILGLLISVAGASVAQAQDRAALRNAQGIPSNIQALKLDVPEELQALPGISNKLSRSLVGARGEQRVVVRLALPAVGKMSEIDEGARLSRKLNIQLEQDGFLQRCGKMAPNMKVIARTQLVLNAVFVEVDAAALPMLAKDPAVTRIVPVADYQMDLSETVPYIGASAVQALGHDGTGIRVAVLDSGIDYNHANLGGSGNPADFAANDPNIVEPGSFPTAKVVGGYDFVGSTWPALPEAPDADPLDDGPGGGHGTHVADIIGGLGGVAPGVDLYAVKVCSSISTSCSGIALIQGMEFAVDPNGDGKAKDAVDIINMSLGSNYGQPFDDDLTQAVENASALGVLTVASSGNSGDKPYITGTPGAAPTALSVAQTQVPSAGLQFITVNAVDYQAVFQPWSVPLTSTLAGPVQYADGAGGNLDGCAPFAAGSLAGMVVLVDRGACNFTLKIKNIGDAGGLLGIIGLVAPGAPFSGGDGGDAPITVPGYMISQADSIAIMAQLGAIATVDPGNTLPLIMQMVGSSSRGPSNYYQAIKPEIGAPGASVSAIAGTGTGTGAFGGTSGAAPMVTGSAALLLDAHCSSKKGSKKGSKNGSKRGSKSKCLAPAVTKALLMNNGETNIDIDPFLGLAEITRIGGGEVRVDAAVSASAVAYEKHTGQGGLSFGFVDVADGSITLKKDVTIEGLVEDKGSKKGSKKGGKKGSKKNGSVKWTVTPEFRYADDAANGAVSLSVDKNEFNIKGNSSKNIKVEMTIDGSLLPGNFMNSGSQGANGAALTANEYDGYLVFTGDNGEVMRMPWQVLPRKAARVETDATFASGGFPTTLSVNNSGVGDAQIDGYTLVATSPDLAEGGAGGQAPTPDLAAFGVTTFPVPAGFCSDDASFLWVFAINTHERQSHLVPVINQVELDINQDGSFDYAVFNFDVSFSGAVSDGRQLAWAQDLVSGSASAFFFAEHATNTGNTVLVVCGEQVGLTGTDLLATNVDVRVSAIDFYYGGPGDEISGLTITPWGEGYFPVAGDIPGNTAGSVDIYDYGLFPGNTPEEGVMLITNGDRGAGARGGATEDTEATLILAQ